jgi:hypothetical protein
MKPYAIIAGKRAEYNPDRNRLTIEFLFPKQNGGNDAGEIKLINGDTPRVIVNAPDSVQVETERRKEEPKKR